MKIRNNRPNRSRSEEEGIGRLKFDLQKLKSSCIQLEGVDGSRLHHSIEFPILVIFHLVYSLFIILRFFPSKQSLACVHPSSLFEWSVQQSPSLFD